MPIRVGEREVDIGRPDKALFPDDGISKRDLAEYYARAAEVMLPHVRGRLVTMHRYPDGIASEGFYQKRVPDYFADWLHTREVEMEGDTLRQLVIDDGATLAYLVDQACITPHVWLSRADRVGYPDRLIVDLDPPSNVVCHDNGTTFDAVRWAARRTREVFGEVGLDCGVMTTGSRGLHVVVPLDADEPFDEVRAFARDLADLLSRRHPDRLTTEQRKAKRGERIYLDVLRNAYAQTTVPPYGVRALPGAPVATPLEWDELDRSDLNPRRYTVENLFRRLGQRDDPWKDLDERAHDLSGPRKRLDALIHDEKSS